MKKQTPSHKDELKLIKIENENDMENDIETKTMTWTMTQKPNRNQE